MTTHERIKKRRKELGLTAEQVADALNVSRATVYRYESAEIEKLPIDIIEPLASILQTTPEYLMGWDLCIDIDDAKIISRIVKKGLNNEQTLPNNLFGLRLLLNDVGYDLCKVNNNYYLTHDTGACIVPEQDILSLLTSTEKYIKFSAYELAKKYSGCPLPPLKKNKEEKK